MFTKIYLAILVISLLLISTVTFLAYNQLQSFGFPPLQIVQNFEYYDGIFKTILWISSVGLLVVANIVLWTTRKSWALWTTFVYFAVFILLDMWWLADSLVAYQKQNNIGNGSFQVGGIFAAFMVVIVGIGIFFNQFIVVRLHDKTFQKTNEEIEKPELVEENKES